MNCYRSLLASSLSLVLAAASVSFGAIVSSPLAVTSLTSSQGIIITGTGQTGFGVSLVGDLNGDGLPDFAVAAPSANSGGGSVYVVYGQPGLTAPGALDLASIDSGDGSVGFVIRDLGAGHACGSSVHNAGDVNGDGIADLIVGAQGANGNTGGAYVIFGGTGLPAVINAYKSDGSSDLDGTNGFAILGETAADATGYCVGVTDYNQDGYADVIIGAPYRNADAGAVYVIYGGSSFPAVLQLSTLTVTNGFRVDGLTANDNLGFSLSGAGDMTGSGGGDVALGAPGVSSNSGAVYVIRAGQSVGSTPVSISNLATFTALGPSGSAAGASVHGIGDFNGDGGDDLIIGAPYTNNQAGAAYVLLGQANGNVYPMSFALASVASLTINGEAAGDQLGYTSSGAGDVNGDGYRDVIVGAPNAASNAGASYVIFGRAGGIRGSLTLSTLDGANGFKINGAVAGDLSGADLSGGSDVNGDGYDELLIGAPGADSQSGAAYLIYGGPSGIAAGAVAVHLINGVGQFNDLDGDLVTVKLKTQIQAGNFDLLVTTTTPTTRCLFLGLNIDNSFEGTDIIVTVKQAAGGDGRVNIGFINAPGVDLGNVTVPGDLGKIVAGSGGKAPAIKSLTVDSLGRFGGTTEDTGSDHGSVITGSIGSLKVAGDVTGIAFYAAKTSTPGTGNIESASIGGSLVGGYVLSSGTLNADSSIGSLKIGQDVVGGAGQYSGQIYAGASIGPVTIGGSMFGGSNTESGAIYCGGSCGKIALLGDLVGVRAAAAAPSMPSAPTESSAECRSAAVYLAARAPRAGPFSPAAWEAKSAASPSQAIWSAARG